jgi:hypothetical protein
MEPLTGFTLVNQKGSGTVDGPVVHSLDGALLVDGLTNHVQDTAKGTGADRHLSSVLNKACMRTGKHHSMTT